MFKMLAISLNTNSKTISPFIDCTVNNSLIKTIPFFHKSLFEMVNVAYAGLINTFLKDAPYLVVHQLEIRAIGGGQRVGEIKSGVSLADLLPKRASVHLGHSVNAIMTIVRVSENHVFIKLRSRQKVT